MSDRLRDAALADLAGLRTRHGTVFNPGPMTRLVTAGVIALVLGLVVVSVVRLDVSLWRIVTGIGELGRITAMMIPPVPASWGQGMLYLHALAETVAIAFLGTLAGAVFAFPIALLAARNTTINRAVQFLARRSSDTIRGIDQLIWALAFVRAVGLGPLAGVMAIAAAEICVLAKLFAEAIENADRRQPEAIVAAGGSRLMAIRYGLLPQVSPVLLAQILYGLEANTRGAAILGVVGAGGIGLQIAERIRIRLWDEVAFIILLILVTVAVIDFVSARVRRRLIG